MAQLIREMSSQIRDIRHFIPTVLRIIILGKTLVVKVPVGGTANFLCPLTFSTGVVDIQWLQNGEPLEESENIMEEFHQFGSGNLQFINVTEDLNMTRIGCIVFLASGNTEELLDLALLIVLG